LDFKKIQDRIERLLSLGGKSFTVQYLKEAHRLTMKTLAGEEPEQSKDIRVAMRRGLPLIIPGSLRLLIEAKDTAIIKYTLTMLSVFRAIPSFPKLKLETITGPPTGIINTLPELGLAFRSLEIFLKGNLSYDYFRQGKSLFTVGRNLIRSTSSGPNHKLSVVGYPADALAFAERPEQLK
jgi:hypothetical protein